MFNQDSGPSNPSIVSHARVTLTAAQVLASFTTPITIVPAQGPGTIIIMLEGVTTLNFNTTAYVPGAGVPSFIFGTNATTFASSASGAFYTQTSSGSVGMRGFGPPSPIPTSVMINQPLTFATTVQNPTAGDGTVDVDIWYVVTKA